MILAPSWQLAKCFQAQLEVSETGEVESHHKRLMTLSGFLLLLLVPELCREILAIGTAKVVHMRSKNISMVENFWTLRVLIFFSGTLASLHLSMSKRSHSSFASIATQTTPNKFTSQSRLLWARQRWENWIAANNMYTYCCWRKCEHHFSAFCSELSTTLIDVALMFARCETFSLLKETQEIFPSFLAP